MRTVTPAFRAAVGKPDTQPATKVTATWPAGVVGAPTDLSALFISIQPQADLTTDAPTGTRLIAGYSTRNASMVLGGAIGGDPTQTVQQLFDPWSTSSPLYDFDWTGISGVKIVIEQGLRLQGVVVPETYVIMTGYVDNCSINRDTGDVTLALLDFRPKLSTVPSLPMILANTIYPTAAPGLSSLPLLEYILAANGIYASPQPRTAGSGAVWYATLHQTLWPQIGSPTSANFEAESYSFSGFQPNWLPGKWAGAAPQQCEIRTATTKTVSFATGHSVLGEGWASLSGIIVGGGAEMVIRSDANNLINFNMGQEDLAGHVYASIDVERSGVTVSTAHAISTSTAIGFFHQIMYRVTFTGATTATAEIWMDGVLTTTNLTGLGAYVSDGVSVELTSNAGLTLDTWQCWADDPTAVPVNFVPTAYLDASLNQMTATPDIRNVTDAWGLIQQLCDAELATGGFDEDLIFRFTNRYNVPGVAGAIVTSLTQIKDLSHEVNEANRARTVTASCTPFAVQPM